MHVYKYCNFGFKGFLALFFRCCSLSTQRRSAAEMKFGPGYASPPSARKMANGVAEKKPSLSKVVGTLKQAVEKLQVAQGLEVEKERRMTLENYITQVELLQTAFTSLADAVLEELDDLATERLRAQREQTTWSSSMQQMEDRVQAKLSQLGSLEDRLDVKLAVAAELPDKMEALSKQQRVADAGMEALRSDVKLLQAQLSRFERSQTLAASQATSGPLNPTQCSQMKEFARDVVQAQVPGLLAASISGSVAPMIHEVVERRSGQLRHDFMTTTDGLAGDISHLAREGAALRADVSAIAGLVKRNELDLTTLSTSLSRLENSETNNPKASMRLVAALEDKMESLAAQQNRYSKSFESVVAALVDDTVALSKSTRQLETHVNHQQGQLQDTKEALLRSAQVFSQLLKVPSPVSSAIWSSPGRRPLGMAEAVSSPYSSPLRNSAATAGGSPLLASKYSSLLSSLP